MSETIDNRNVFSLFEVTKSIQKTIAERYRSTFWVKAEMHKLNHYSQSGHCYPELVEKTNGRTIAEMRSIIWKDDYHRINNHFKQILKEPLRDGITVLFCAKISYDPKYGLTLIISDIDPSYSLGELEKEKALTIQNLKHDGCYDNNRLLSLPVVPKRIAIISVETSKGYSDFLKIMNGNPWKYTFFQMLFPALLQGEKAIASILHQLKRISAVRHHFDAVAIIRGGGGDVGLSCYNDYSLAKAIACFPIPVLTGIGHSTNETVAEMVAFKNAITPSELADFIIRKFHDFSVPVQKATDIISDKTKRRLREENSNIVSTVKYFRSVSRSMLIDNKNLLNNQQQALSRLAVMQMRNASDKAAQLARRCISSGRQIFSTHRTGLLQIINHVRKDSSSNILKADLMIRQKTADLNRSIPALIRDENKEINNLEKSIINMDPVNVLRRGYSITLLNGKAVTSVEQLETGDEIITKLADGDVVSKVE